MARAWKGVLVIEGEQTGDGRVIAPGAVTWAELPLPLGDLVTQQHGDGMGNAGGAVVGNITSVTRQDDGTIIGEGVIDDDTERGAEICRLMDEGLAPLGHEWGISIDPDNWAVEVVDTRAETVAEEAAEPESELRVLTRMHGSGGVVFAVTAAAGDPDPVGGVVVMEDCVDGVIQRFTQLRMRGATLCAIAAFDRCRIGLAVDESAPGAAPATAITAAARFGGVPVTPPRAWFFEPAPVDDDDPRLVEQFDIDSGEFIGLATPLTVITEGPDRGKVFGHLGPEKRCHVGLGCSVTPAALASDYTHFMLGSTPTTDGEVPTGPLLVGCEHASHTLSARGAADHYAHTGMAWADVHIVNTKHGPWFSGALRPDVTDELVRVVKSSGQVSGDWRGDTGKHELLAVQVVSTPGFTVQRIRPIAASARVVELAPYRPRLQLDGGVVTYSTQPVTAAAPKDCACQHNEPAAVTAAGLGELARVLSLIERRTRGMNVQRVEAARARLMADE